MIEYVFIVIQVMFFCLENSNEWDLSTIDNNNLRIIDDSILCSQCLRIIRFSICLFHQYYLDLNRTRRSNFRKARHPRTQSKVRNRYCTSSRTTKFKSRQIEGKIFVAPGKNSNRSPSPPQTYWLRCETIYPWAKIIEGMNIKHSNPLPINRYARTHITAYKANNIHDNLDVLTTYDRHTTSLYSITHIFEFSFSAMRFSAFHPTRRRV